MALIAMAVYDTVENDRTKFTNSTLIGLINTVNLYIHRVVIVDNGSCQATKDVLDIYKDKFKIITLSENLGTAKGINYAWRLRERGEFAVKLDNDVLIYDDQWVDKMQEAMERDASIGILALKRKDLPENPESTNNFYRTSLRFLPNNGSQSWIVFERANHAFGTVQMYSPQVLDKIGYLVQPSIYGFDDNLASIRAMLAGFSIGYLPSIEIDHIDTGENLYQKEKEKIASNDWEAYKTMVNDYQSGKLKLYYED